MDKIGLKTKIHLGCGSKDFGSEWFHVDLDRSFSHVEWSNILSLPYKKDQVDLIYASHLLEHLFPDEAKMALMHWRDILKPGGILRLAVPNFEKIAKLYLQKKYNINAFLGLIYGGKRHYRAHESIYHKVAFDKESLTALLASVGYTNITEWDWRNVDHGDIDDFSQAYLPHMDKVAGELMSLNLECTKPL